MGVASWYYGKIILLKFEILKHYGTPQTLLFFVDPRFALSPQLQPSVLEAVSYLLREDRKQNFP